jgi:pseudouridine-5'-phosphate glycosidase
MAIAHRAGARWFATGGVGGVHRGAVDTFDESADLLALARYPVGVVSAGAKSVLDLPRTLERLETLGVPVIGFGTDELPAFHHGASGLPTSLRLDAPEDVARVGIARFDRLGEGGLLVAQPPPPEHAASPEGVERLIEAALAEAEAGGIRGRDLTPHLLGTLARASGGALVETNIALVESNARLAARVAVADARLRFGPS